MRHLPAMFLLSLLPLHAFAQSPDAPTPATPPDQVAPPTTAPAGDAWVVMADRFDHLVMLKGMGFHIGTRRLLLASCTPETALGKAILPDLLDQAHTALDKATVLSAVEEDPIPEGGEPGCPDEEELTARAKKHNAHFVLLVDIHEDEVTDGFVPVNADLLNAKGKVLNSYRPREAVVAGPADSHRIATARARAAFAAKAWHRDTIVSTYSVMQRGMSSMMYNLTPAVRDEHGDLLDADQVATTPGTEDLAGRASTLQNSATALQVLGWTRFGTCLAFPAAGVCAGGLVGAVFGLVSGGQPSILATYVGLIGLAGLVAGAVVGGVGALILTVVSEIISQVRRFMHVSFADDAVTQHNTKLAKEHGLDPKDLNRKYFP